MSEYLGVCPKCESTDTGIDGTPVITKRMLIRKCFCWADGCNHEWDERFVFVRYENRCDVGEFVDNE